MAEQTNGWTTTLKKVGAWILGLLALITLFGVGTVPAKDRVGLIVFTLLFGAGAYFLWRSAERSSAARLAEVEEEKRAELVELQQEVISLAIDHDGVLTVTDVVADLDYPIEWAEHVLKSLDDGVRVTATLTEQGVIVYEFREVMHRKSRLGAPRG